MGRKATHRTGHLRPWSTSLAVALALWFATEALPAAETTAPPSASAADSNSWMASIENVPSGGAAAFRILGAPQRGVDGRWRIRWQSTPGLTYKLQRQEGDAFLPGLWADVVTIKATATITTATDPDPFETEENRPSRFYRIVETDGFRIVSLHQIDGGWRVTWQCQPDHTYRLQRALALEPQNTLWMDVATVTATSSTTAADDLFMPQQQQRFYRVVRVNATSMDFSTDDPYLFTPLSGNGQPENGQRLQIEPDGSLPAFEFYPAGLDILGFGQGLILRFPSGARLVETNGQRLLEFVDVTAQFGSRSVLQFPQPLEKFGGVTRYLSLGPVSLGALAALFDLDPMQGLPVELFGRFPLIWQDGLVQDGGIQGARFGLPELDVPLPVSSGEFPSFGIEFSDVNQLRLPFQGEFTLPDGTDDPPTFAVGGASPLWVTLGADGRMTVDGQISVRLGNGIAFQAALSFADPSYHLELISGSLIVAGLRELSPGLPDVGNLCLPGGLDGESLTAATLCLENLALGLQAFGAASAGQANGVSVSLSPLPWAASSTALLEAWARAGLAHPSSPLALDIMLPEVQRLRTAAPQLADFSLLLAQAAALTRAQWAVSLGGLLSSPEMLTELQSAWAETSMLISERLSAPDLPVDLASTQIFLQRLEDYLDLAADAGQNVDPTLAAKLLPDYLDRFTAQHAGSLGVTSGQFVATGPSPLTSLSPYDLRAQLASLIELGDRAALIVPSWNGSLFDETLGQLATRLLMLAESELEAAESSEDYRRFLFALLDIADLIDYRQRSYFPTTPALDFLPQAPSLSQYLTRIGPLLHQALQSPAGQRSLRDRTLETAAWLKILDLAPTLDPALGVDLAELFHDLEASLAAALELLPEESDPATLRQWLEAGTRHADLGRRLGLFPSANWENVRLPTLISRLIALTQSQGSWWELDAAAGFLFTEAARQGRRGALNLQQTLLGSVADLLGSTRDSVAAVFDEQQAQNASTEPAEAADLQLPGDLTISGAAGSITFNRETGEFDGTFRGRLHLGLLQATLDIQEASLASNGDFVIAASGEFQLPPTDPTLTVTIPDARPIRIAYSAANGIEFSGAAGFRFANGLYFQGDLQLIDPIYSFAIQAGGLDLNLLLSTLLTAPAFPAANTVTDDQLTLWHDYLEGLERSLSGFVPETAAAPNSNGAGLQGPDAGTMLVGLPSESFDSLEIYSTLMQIQALLAGDPDPAMTRGPLTEIVVNLGRELLQSVEAYAPFANEGNGGGVVDNSEDMEPVLLAAPGSTPRELQIDFGGSNFKYTITGPAHELGLLSEDHLEWNTLTTDTASGLAWADGNAAPGVAIDLGRYSSLGQCFTTELGSPEWTFIPIPFQTTSDETYLLRDGILSSDFTTPQATRLAARLSGLGPGHYALIGIAVSPYTDPTPHALYLGKLLANGAPEVIKRSIAASNVELYDWIEGRNYAVLRVNLANAEEQLLLLSGIAGTQCELDANWGQLQGLQVVELFPRIQSFTANPTLISPGERAELSWKTIYAASRTLSPGIGAVPEQGKLKVAPRHTTTYTLRAANGSGSRSAAVTVTVDGPARELVKVTQSLRKLGRTYRLISTAINKAAEAALRGKDEYVDTDELKRYLDDATSNVIRSVLANTAAMNDLKTSSDVVAASLDIVGTYQALGLDETLAISEIAAFQQGTLQAFEKRSGYNAANDTVDQATVQAKSYQESVATIKNLLDLYADSAILGGPDTPNAKLLNAYLTNARDKALAAVRYDPATQQTDLSGLSLEKVREAKNNLINLLSTSQLVNQELEVSPAALLQIQLRIQDLALEKLQTLPLDKTSQRLAALVDISDVNDFLLTQSMPTRYLVEIQSEARNLATQLGAAASSERRTTKEELALMDYLRHYLPDDHFANPISQRLAAALRAIQAELAQPWTLQQLPRGVPMLEELVSLQLLLKQLQGAGINPDLTAEQQPQALILLLNSRVQTAASSNFQLKELAAFARAVRQAAHRFGFSVPNGPANLQGSNALTGTTEPDPFGVFLFEQSTAATAVAASVADDLLAQFQANQSSLLPIDLELPGNPKVTRVFGELYYNRETQFLRGSFGGRLDFPEMNAYFEIGQATLASDGSFELDVSTAGPLPFGGVHITASAHVIGQPNGFFSFDGMGELILPTMTTTQIYNVAVTYNTDDNRFRFDSTAQNLDLRFTDDFVLFDAGFGFEISLAEPEGRFSAIGSAGIYARTKPLPVSAANPTNFFLLAENVSPSFTYRSNGFTASLDSGTLWLPEYFSPSICPSNQPGTADGPAVLLDPDHPIQVTFELGDPPAVSFSGAFQFANLGLQIPGLPGFAVEICTATLDFPTNQLPHLTNLFATIQIPIPNQTGRVDVVNGEWSINGFPTGTIRLQDNLTLFEQGGFSFLLLGASDESCPPGTGLTVARQPNGQPSFQLDGGIEMNFPTAWLSDTNGGRLFALSCGYLNVTGGLPPQLGLTELAFGGSFQLGGPDGLLVQDALVELSGLTNLFAANPFNAFVIDLSGLVQIPDGPGFGLQNARFEFMGEPLPRFTLGGLTVTSDPNFEIIPGLGVTISEATLQFLDPDRPLPQLLAPDNLRLTMSAAVGIPSGPDPIITGRFDDLSAVLVDGVLQIQLAGIGLGINNFEVPPLTLTGQVYLGGLSDPENVFFAGRVGGKLNGAGVVALVALNLRGPIGVCLDVSAGPAGIPLGPTGFLLTGVAGGVSFLNSNGDPCDFTSYYPVDDSGYPVEMGAGGSGGGILIRPGETMTWEQFDAWRQRRRLYEEAYAEIAARAAASPNQTITVSGQSLFAGGAGTGAGTELEIPCPTGDCPPPTINILCQPHPDAALYPDRVIFKFTSLDESFLNDVGITPTFIASLGLTTADDIAVAVAGPIRRTIDVIFPRADAALVGESTAFAINLEITNQLNQAEQLFRDAFRQAIQPFLGDNDTVYGAIREAAYAGVPCQDATVKLTGTFSHATVSSFLSASVGAVLSSAGSAGLVGSVNLLGIPVGTLDGFVAGTDNRGDPNPSACGVIKVSVGPLELGALKTALECPQCLTGVLGSFADFAGCLTEDIIHAVLLKVAPEKATLTGAEALGALTDEEKFAFLSQLFTLPTTPGLPECFYNLVSGSWDSIQPSFTLCGEAAPRLFGIPLVGELVSVQMAADKRSLAGAFSFSPSYLLQNAFLCIGSGGTFCQGYFPALDQASYGFGVGFPDAGELLLGGLSGRFNSPQAVAGFAEEGFDYLLENATYTIGYEINPFGLKIADAEARVIMPNLTDHPARFDPPIYVRPEDRNLGLPSREELLLAALEVDLLGNPLWKGTAEDLPIIYPEGSPERSAVQGLSFAHDYFPYGGMAGAMRLLFPRAIVEAPPPSLATLLDPTADVFARLGAAGDFVSNYLLTSTNVGALAFYIPAPNPPFLVNDQGQPLSPRELLEAIQTFDASALAFSSLYPVEQAFLNGYVHGQLLGVPIADAKITAIPVNPQTGEGGLFRVTAGVPAGSWFQSFVDQADLVFEIKQSPPLPLEVRFASLLEEINGLAGNNDPTAAATMVDSAANSLTADLPKISLEATLDNFHVPDLLTNLLTAGTSVGIYAYSTAFEPTYQGFGPVADARRKGGLAFQGQFRLANLITIDDAQLAVFPKPIGPPGLAGLFNAPLLTLPGATLHDVMVNFNTEPAPGDPFLAASGIIDPIHIPPFLTMVPLDNNATQLTGSLLLTNPGDNSPPVARLSIDPARLESILFGEGLRLQIHGATPADPFSFSTEDAWEATVSVEGSLSLRDVTGTRRLLEIGDLGSGFTAALHGQGTAYAELTLELPTGLIVTAYPDESFAQTLTLGNPGADPIRLTIASDGTFELLASFEDGLNLANLPINGLNAGATVRITETLFDVAGSFIGGALASVQWPSAQGHFIITNNLVLFSAEATLPALQFDRFLISAIDGGDLSALLGNNGISFPDGARLAITGISDQLLTLQPWTVQNNGDFNVQVASGAVHIPGYLELSGGTAALSKAGDVVNFSMNLPALTVLPNTTFSTMAPSPLSQLIIASSGEFYYDSGIQTLALPYLFSASGRLELGYHVDATAPRLSLSTAALNLGSVNIGQTVEQTFQIKNTGGQQLLASIRHDSGPSLNVSPSFLSVAPGDVVDVTARFSPTSTNQISGSLEITSTAPNSPQFINYSGQGRAAPVWYQNLNTLSFGEQPVGQTAQLPFIVANLGLAPLSFGPLLSPSPYVLTPNAATIPPGEQQLFFVRFTPPDTNIYNRTLTIPDNLGVNHNLNLTGTGGQQRWYTQRESSGQLRRLRMIDAAKGWAVGDGGLAFRTSNGGHAWSPARIGGTLAWRALDFNDQNGLLGGASGVVYWTSDGGATWNLATDSDVTDPGVTWNDTAFYGTVTAVLAGEKDGAGRIVRRTANTVFSTITIPATSALKGMAMQPGSTLGLAVGENGAILRSTTSGGSWTVPNSAPSLPGLTLNAVDFDPTSVAIAVGDFGAVLKSVDAGLNWTRLNNLPTTAFLYDVRVKGNDVWIAGEGVLLRSGNQGANWTVESLPSASSLYTVEEYQGRVWTAGRYARIHHRPLNPVTTPILTYSTADADFGTVPVGVSRQIRVQIANAGLGTLDVTDLADPVGSTFDVTPHSLPGLEPGQSATATLFYTPSAAGDDLAAVRLTSNDPDGLQFINLQGRAVTSTWSLLGGPTNENLLAVQFTTDTIGYAISANEVFKTSDGGANWSALGANPPGALDGLIFISSTIGWVYGGRNGNTTFQCNSNCQSTLLHTVDGGLSWEEQATGVRNALADLHMLNSQEGFAVTKSYTAGASTVQGDVLHTANGGASWTARTRPEATFNGSAVRALSSSVIFASTGGSLHRSANGGAAWSPILTLGGARPINDIFFLNSSTGWVGGNDANAGFLYRTTTGGGSTGAWTALTSLPAPISQIHFINANTGWLAVNRPSIYRTDNGGVSTADELAGLGGQNINGVWGRSASLAYAVGLNGTFRKYQPFNPTPQGLAILPPVFDLGTIPAASNHTFQIALQNIGTAPLNILGLEIRNNQSTGQFGYAGPQRFSLPAGSTTNLTLTFHGDTLGALSGEMRLATDGTVGLLKTLLKATTEDRAVVVMFDSEPPGISGTLGSDLFQIGTPPTPFALSVNRSGAGGALTPGTVLTVNMPATAVVDGVTYRFQGWNEGSVRWSLNYVASLEPKRFIARYVPAYVQIPPALLAAPIGGAGGGGPPNDLPAGPYLRLSQAGLNAPGLGDLQMDGAVFLSANEIMATLLSGSVRIPTLTSLPEVVKVGAGSWNFHYLDKNYTRLSTVSPNLDLLGVPVLPAGEMFFDYEATGDYTAQFETQGNWPILPGLFEFGPGTVTLTRIRNVQSFSMNANLKMLRRPDGTFVLDQTRMLSFSERPTTNTISSLPNPLVAWDYFGLIPTGSTRLEYGRSSTGNLHVGVRNATLTLFGQMLANASAVTGTGGLNFSLGSGRLFTLGPFTLQSTSTSQFTWDALQGSVTGTLAGGSLQSSQLPGWPAAGLTIPSLSVDTQGDFERTIVLPTFSLGLLSLGGDPSEEVNYLRIKRQNGTVSGELHDQATFFGSTMEIHLSLNPNGTVTGSFNGDFEADFSAIGLGKIPFADIALEYDGGDPLYQFRGTIRSEQFPDLQFQAAFGSGGGQVCYGVFCLTSP